MANRTYIDLKNDINKMDSVWQDVSNRYDSIPETLMSAEIDPKIKEAVLYSVYNAKAWYSTYMIQKLASITGNNQSYDLAELTLDKISYWIDRTNTLVSLLQSISAQNADENYWGYKERYSDWQDSLYYDHLRMIDETYGNDVTRNREIFNSVSDIQTLNSNITLLYNRFKNLDLPYQVWQTKTTEDIDYSKISVDIKGLSNNQVISLGEEDFAKAGTISSLKIPALDEGQYMLRIYNKNTIRLSNIVSLDNGWYNVTVNRISDLTGWLIDNKYPVFKSEPSTNRNDLRIYLGRELTIKQDMFAYENYINDVSFLIDCKLNVENAVYDFFYGSYLDEFIDVAPNGNYIYRRSIKDKAGNSKAIYQLELDFNTKTESGMPILHYLRMDQ